ncbi:tetratricopeptide repeat protein [Streptomyces niveiscabiei]|uniref:tetratricopeptide repeat protein n=1 Tax=Streptomyces niveiscabiei TaxID=164115 RepID=UPI0029A7E45B|nr:tetratricopeptide repeat protein [Streptomyces niveiscabiei]MDX3383689.1 tetratricopeptide repeat protein [Streptomyces niveiscabiei]
MSRPSREPQSGPAVMAPAPIDVRVATAAGRDTASVGGVPVTAPEGEEIKHAVLAHLRRIAVATGHPVLATIHDERSGYDVPIQVAPDGSSTLMAEPTPLTAPHAHAAEAPPATSAPEPQDDGYADEAPSAAQPPAPTDDAYAALAPGTVTAPTGVFGPPPAMDHLEPQGHPGTEGHPASEEHVASDERPAFPGTPGPQTWPEPEAPPEPSYDTPEPPAPSSPLLDTRPQPVPLDTPPSRPTRAPLLDPATTTPEPSAKHTPARGFDAVAEAVLGDDPREADGVEPGPLAGPVARINEAVRAGRIDTAAGLAEQTVTDASAALGADHPEVLRLRELAAYIAYLAGDPVRAFHVSLDVARAHRHAGDAEAAYGNVQSAATAWRAVREPVQGLNLGNELLGLWTTLATEGGPAAEDPTALDSARSRMLRLAERAAAVR